MSRKIRLCCEITVSAYTIVDADTEEEAIEIANDRSAVLREGYVDEEDAEECWLITEADGMPQNIKVDE